MCRMLSSLQKTSGAKQDWRIDNARLHANLPKGIPLHVICWRGEKEMEACVRSEIHSHMVGSPFSFPSVSAQAHLPTMKGEADHI